MRNEGGRTRGEDKMNGEAYQYRLYYLYRLVV